MPDFMRAQNAAVKSCSSGHNVAMELAALSKTSPVS